MLDQSVRNASPNVLRGAAVPTRRAAEANGPQFTHQ